MERRSIFQLSAKESLSGELFSTIYAAWRYDYVLIKPKWIMRHPDMPEKYSKLFAMDRFSFRIEKKDIIDVKEFITQIIDMRAVFFNSEERRSIIINIEDGYDICVSYKSGYVIPFLKSIFK